VDSRKETVLVEVRNRQAQDEALKGIVAAGYVGGNDSAGRACSRVVVSVLSPGVAPDHPLARVLDGHLRGDRGVVDGAEGGNTPDWDCDRVPPLVS
jgi:hypothetical protein